MPGPDRQGRAGTANRNSKANPKVIKTLKCKTVAEGKFRHANYIRKPRPSIVDEPPGPASEKTRHPIVGGVIGRVGSMPCGRPAPRQRRSPRWLATSSNSNSRATSNITAVWGTGDVSEKPVGFTDVRVKVDGMQRRSQSEIDATGETT